MYSTVVVHRQPYYTHTSKTDVQSATINYTFFSFPSGSPNYPQEDNLFGVVLSSGRMDLFGSRNVSIDCAQVLPQKVAETHSPGVTLPRCEDYAEKIFVSVQIRGLEGIFP